MLGEKNIGMRPETKNLPDRNARCKEILEKYECHIEGPSYNESGLPHIKEEYFDSPELRESIEGLKHFLCNEYFIIDSFGNDHNQRREFENKLANEYPDLRIDDWIDKNGKLGLNNQRNQRIHMFRMRRIFKEKNLPIAEQLQSIENELNEKMSSLIGERRYQDLSLDEKIQGVRSLEECAYKFLECLST